MKLDLAKLKLIVEFKTPKEQGDVARFLDMVKYLVRYTENLSQWTFHQRSQLNFNVVFNWSPEHEKEFNELKRMQSSQPLIQFYNSMLPTKISFDASKTGLGVILEQQHEDQWLPVTYTSRAITEIQGRYAPIEREALAIQFACDHFHQYIYGRPVQLEMDHKSHI